MAVLLIWNISDVPQLSASDEPEDSSFIKVAESRAWVWLQWPCWEQPDSSESWEGVSAEALRCFSYDKLL
jgi:hypothetical protein